MRMTPPLSGTACGVVSRTILLILLMLCFYAPWLWAGINEGRVSLDAGVDWTTDDFFRGFPLASDESIVQPFADIIFRLYEGGSGLNSLDAKLGIWNSFHGGETGATGESTTDPKFWFESDLYAGITLGLANVLELGITYTLITSPNGSFSDVGELKFDFSFDDSHLLSPWDLSLLITHAGAFDVGDVDEIELNLSFDDSHLLGPWALSPTLTLVFEVGFQADGGRDKGVYLELGIAPGMTLAENDQISVEVSVPLILGLSLNDYYENENGRDDTFGYFDAGITVNAGLGLIPKSFGSVSLTLAGHVFFFNDTLEAINDGEAIEAVGLVGLSLLY